MPKIKCDQHDCKYNNSTYCIKEGICVSDNAYCESFKKGKLDRNYLFEFGSFENEDRNIMCNACDCKHNKNCNCKANCICVSDNPTLCKYYKKK